MSEGAWEIEVGCGSIDTETRSRRRVRLSLNLRHDLAVPHTTRRAKRRQSASQQNGLLFDHLVRDGKQIGRYVEAEHIHRFQIDDEIKLGRSLHWQIAKFSAFENSIDVRHRTSKYVGLVRCITHQSTFLDGLTKANNGWQPVLQCLDDNLMPVHGTESAWRSD
jgi:hypothetical protein